MKDSRGRQHSIASVIRSPKSWPLFTAALMLLLFLLYYDGIVNAIDSTMFAFSYKYGFVSRGLLGTVLRVLNLVFPAELLTYGGVKGFSFVMTVLYALLLLVFYAVVRNASDKALAFPLFVLSLFTTIFILPIFLGEENFGRLDIYMAMATLLGALCIIKQRFEFLVPVFAGIGCMVHQGYVFMFANVLLVLLLFRFFTSEDRAAQKKYGVLFLLTFAAVSVLFLWFELFSHGTGPEAYDEIVSVARTLSVDGKTIHQDVIDKEILGIDISGNETIYRPKNALEFIVFCVFMCPYIALGAHFFAGLFRKAAKPNRKIAVLLAAAGALTIVPDMLLKIDFGRWMNAVIFYYAVTVFSLCALKDEDTARQLQETLSICAKRRPLSWLLLIYPFAFQPFLAIYISPLTSAVSDWLNAHLLHLWG